MSYLSRLNKRLNRLYKGRIRASEDRGRLHLTGELDEWQDIVEAGLSAVNKKEYAGLVNDIKLAGAQTPKMRVPAASDDTLDGLHPDVLVVGGGIVGCAIARELTRYKLDVLLAEKEHDVALHASGRNDGMVHPGVDLRKGQLKQKYNERGNRMYEDICRELGVPFRPCGQYICYAKRRMKPVAAASMLYWKMMKIPAEHVNAKKLREREPNLSPQIAGALFFPTAGVVCPYGLTIAYAENAADNGARICLDTAVLDMDVTQDQITSVMTNRGRIRPKLVINAAGVFTEEIAKMARDHFFSIHPRKGTNIILDKKTAYLVRTIASSLGTVAKKAGHSKGGGIVHTIDGNLLVGPNAIETPNKENFGTERENVRDILSKQRQTCPGLKEKDIITYFTGVRAATYEEDFIISFGKSTANIIHAAGIQSPGLTAAPAIAVDIAKMAAEYLGAQKNDAFRPIRTPIPRTAGMPREDRDALIQQDRDYGTIVCRCEEVSRGEIREALHRSVPCDTVDGVKRRVRPGMGRCQGGFCGPLVARIIAEELHIPIEQVEKNGPGSTILFGDNKEGV